MPSRCATCRPPARWELADDPTVIGRYPAQLQQVDIVMQTLAHLGRLLLAERPEAVLATIGIDDLRRRLERVSLP